MTDHQGAQALSGFLNLLKPPGMTSAQAVAFVRRALGGAHIGHAGTLDPQAAGVLPLMLGKATRLFDYLQDKEKRYIAEVAFGAETDTLDAQGVITREGSETPSAEAIRAALPAFIGEIMQRPPMVSAIKRDGKRMYDVARAGGIVALEPRPVTVHSIAFLGETARRGARLDIRCGKGFYVRSLCRDLGESLGCPAHMRFLLRAQSGVFTLENAVTLEELAGAENPLELLLPMDFALSHLPRADVPDTLFRELENGVPIPVSRLPRLERDTPLRLYAGGALAAIGEARDGFLKQRTWLKG